MPLDDQVERAGPAGEARVDQRRLVQLGQRPSTRSASCRTALTSHCRGMFRAASTHRMVPSSFSGPTSSAEHVPTARCPIRPHTARKLQIRLVGEQLLDLSRTRNAGPRPRRPAIQGRGGIGVRQHILDIPSGASKTRRDEGAPEDVPAPVCRGSPLETPACGSSGRRTRPGCPSARASRRRARAPNSRADGLERPAGLFICRSTRWEILGGDDRVDVAAAGRRCPAGPSRRRSPSEYPRRGRIAPPVSPRPFPDNRRSGRGRT